MKALCVRQPYAELIARGIKTDEVRTWYSAHRGQLAICASSQAHYDEETQETARKHGIDIASLPRGCVVCIVDMRDAGHYTEEHYSTEALCHVDEDLYYFELANPRRTKRHAVKGRLNIFELGFEPERL